MPSTRTASVAETCVDVPASPGVQQLRVAAHPLKLASATSMPADRARDPLPAAPEDELEIRRLAAHAEALLFGGPPAPVRIGRFEVRGRLGEGGLGVVYAGRDPALDRPVALKLLRRDAARSMPGEDEAERRRMLREARMMARLSHPNVVTVHEVGEHEGRVFLAMELVEGQTLRAWTAAASRTWREVADVLQQAGNGLAAAHAAGVVHRDFKPDNVLIGQDGRVRVTDFGLARSESFAAAPADVTAGESRGASTTAGDATHPAAGTPAYMAPEQHGGTATTAASDQFAFCVTAYEALFGSLPFDGHGRALAEAKTAGVRGGPPRSSPVPEHIARALARGMSPRQDDRWPSIAALLAALGDEPSRRALRRWILAAVWLVLGFALVGAALQLWMFSGWMRDARQRLDRPAGPSGSGSSRGAE
jgi:serine/threonine protein kinase